MVILLTAPSAPAKEREHYLVAQPPRLGKAGNFRQFDFMCKAQLEEYRAGAS